MKIITILTALVLMFPTAKAADQKSSSHVSREAAIQLLRNEGILHGSTRVASAYWHEDIREWLITLHHPGGTLSAWFVDAKAQNYHGGPCKH
jgi:hypothetical protein